MSLTRTQAQVRDTREAPDCLYRYIDREYAEESGVQWRSVQLVHYPVVRRTPRGVWVTLGYRKEKFVLLSGDRRFAYPEADLDLAIKSYRRRKRMQAWHAEQSAMRAKFGASVKTEDFPKPFGPEHRVSYDDLVVLEAA